MSNNLTWADCEVQAICIADRICGDNRTKNNPIQLYGVPRGGVYPALMVQGILGRRGYHCSIVEDPIRCDIIIDDIIDSGATRNGMIALYQKPFYALVDKTDPTTVFPTPDDWIVFPWELMGDEQGPEQNIVRVLEYLGEDSKREGLLETPKRVIKSFDTLYGGYKMKVEDCFKVFEEDDSDEMVVFKNVEFYSTCEHHMLPFFGKAHIAYIPNGKVIGVSKLARILEVYARRLQIQERLCQQVTSAIEKALSPKGAACVLEAQHFCMTSRGVQKQNSIMVTSSVTGEFRSQKETRAEFMGLIGK